MKSTGGSMNEINIHTKEDQGRQVIHPFCHVGMYQDDATYEEEGSHQILNLPAPLTLDFSTSRTVDFHFYHSVPTLEDLVAAA